MKNVSGATTNEKKMIKAIQSAVGAVQDGSIGTQTMSDIACRLGADCFPLALTIYDNPVIIAKDILPAAVGSPLSCYANAISGSFSYQKKPCSILISNGKLVCGAACHAWFGKPESVLYRLTDGSFGLRKILYSTELPNRVSWAIGGVGLLDRYNPTEEGFTGSYGDVLRSTNHTMVGVKNGYVYLCYVSNATGAQVNDYAKRLGLERAVLLDGGHVAAINSGDRRINTAQTQYYIVQALAR